MTTRRTEVGPCGNFCGGCPDFRVLKEGDDAFRRQVAANLTQEVGRPVSPEEVGCEGCWGGIHNALAASLECRIRQCADGKGFATCAECGDFPCVVYLKQFQEVGGCHQNIRAIQAAGLDQWIDRQVKEREP